MILGWHFCGSPAWFTHHYAKNNTPLLVKIYPKSNKRKMTLLAFIFALARSVFFCCHRWQENHINR
jgi:hypothetical protein